MKLVYLTGIIHVELILDGLHREKLVGDEGLC